MLTDKQKREIARKYSAKCRDRLENYMRDILTISKIIVQGTPIEEEIDTGFENAVSTSIAAIPADKMYMVYTVVDSVAQILRNVDIVSFVSDMLDTMDDIPYEYVEYSGTGNGKWVRDKIVQYVAPLLPDDATRGVVSGVLISCKPLMKAYEYLAKLIYLKDRAKLTQIAKNIVDEMKMM